MGSDEVRISTVALSPIQFLASVNPYDTDADGLPDAWENLHFRSLTFGPDDDNDGEGESTAMELFTGTLPDSAASRFALTIAPAGGSQLSLTWPSVPGKSYTIETNDDIAGGWDELISLPAADSPATSTSHSFTPSGAARFYPVLHPLHPRPIGAWGRRGQKSMSSGSRPAATRPDILFLRLKK